MKPSPTLLAKRGIPFTTKQVGKGFYRGTGTGSMGAHTEYGGYLIDWRKVRHFNVPKGIKKSEVQSPAPQSPLPYSPIPHPYTDLTNTTQQLTPFVTAEMEPTRDYVLDPKTNVRYYPKRIDGMRFLRDWKLNRNDEYEEILAHQKTMAQAATLERIEEEADRKYLEEFGGAEKEDEKALKHA